MRRIQIHIDAALDDAAAAEARRRGVSKAAFIRACVEEAVRQPLSEQEAWKSLAGWLDSGEPVDDIDEYLYGPVMADDSARSAT